ncbi:MAG: hypothetical protein ACQES1_02470 [Bacteroidota bacterium]
MKRIDDIPKRNPFKTPEGYFNEFPEKLQDRINANKERQPANLLQALKPYFYFIAFFVALAFLFKFGVDKLSSDFQNQEKTEQITENESLYYEYEFISDDMIYEELIAVRDTTSENNINEEMIADYLLEEDVEYLLYE